MSLNRSKRHLTFALAAVCFTGTSMATETLSVVGSWSSLPLHKLFETPFWTKTLPADSHNEFQVKLTTHDQMGLGGGDVFRMLSDGVFDVGMTVADYAVSDAPALEALDVPLIATRVDEFKKIVDAARPMVDDVFKSTFNSKVLAIVPYSPQVVFCKVPVKSLDDLSGLKIRASGRMTAKFLEALGAQSVNISFGEVPGALQRGVIDCAVTGAGSGYSAGWWEVTSYLVTLPIGGWDPVVTAINLDKWNSLSKKDQDLLENEVKTKFEAPVWEDAKLSVAQDVACLTGNGECSRGKARNLILVTPSAADKKKALNLVETKVLPEWAKRAGKKWTTQWDNSVGVLVGLTAAAKE